MSSPLQIGSGAAAMSCGHVKSRRLSDGFTVWRLPCRAVGLDSCLHSPNCVLVFVLLESHQGIGLRNLRKVHTMSLFFKCFELLPSVSVCYSFQSHSACTDRSFFSRHRWVNKDTERQTHWQWLRWTGVWSDALPVVLSVAFACMSVQNYNLKKILLIKWWDDRS